MELYLKIDAVFSLIVILQNRHIFTFKFTKFDGEVKTLKKAAIGKGGGC